jgi:hypothetical protein
MPASSAAVLGRRPSQLVQRCQGTQPAAPGSSDCAQQHHSKGQVPEAAIQQHAALPLQAWCGLLASD